MDPTPKGKKRALPRQASCQQSIPLSAGKGKTQLRYFGQIIPLHKIVAVQHRILYVASSKKTQLKLLYTIKEFMKLEVES